jgi:mono/diheme cytochrome c family protein
MSNPSAFRPAGAATFNHWFKISLALALWGGGSSLFAQQTAPKTGTPPDFVHQIAPILKQHCANCHTGDKKKGGFSLNTQGDWNAGSENGPVFDAKSPHQSKALQVLFSEDPDVVMPPPEKDRARPTKEQLDLLRKWILAGAPWEAGYAFKKPAYNAPVKPRLPQLPPAVDGRTHPIDRLLDAYLAKNHLPLPELSDDATFARRVHMDLIGLLPSPEALQSFINSKAPDKRDKLIDALLNQPTEYTEHWMTFWNDLLRNDYGGTGFITGGRKQVSTWLYDALKTNMPYDAMVRSLVNPGSETEGYAQGITWRGTVSASQTREVQYAQSISQSFLGLNFKCASCHDSFIDKWKLTDAYGLAAVYTDKPIEISRCEKGTGKMAVASFPFPEIGQINPEAPRPERLKQLADLMTHPENGWLARTITNRLWAALLGHGLVHPVDAMGTEPWSEEILDYLGWDLAQNKYDLKKALRLITTSRAYQSKAEIRAKDDNTGKYVFRGPRAKRLTAEQFIDLLWQVTGTTPLNVDAPVRRGVPDSGLLASTKLNGRFIQAPEAPPATPEGPSPEPKTGQKPAAKGTAAKTVPLTALHKVIDFPAKPVRVSGVLSESAGDSARLVLNGQLIAPPKSQRDKNAPRPRPGEVQEIQIKDHLTSGPNVFTVVQTTPKNGSPSPVYVELEAMFADGKTMRITSDSTWQAGFGFNEESLTGKIFAVKNPVFSTTAWVPVLNPDVTVPLDAAKPVFVVAIQPELPTRAALLKADLLMRTLGRPNRDQIVTSRPQDLSTLEALDLAAGQRLSQMLTAGAGKVSQRKWDSDDALVDWLFQATLARHPSAVEKQASVELLAQAGTPKPTAVEDLLWSMFALPEFQLVR